VIRADHCHSALANGAMKHKIMQMGKNFRGRIHIFASEKINYKVNMKQTIGFLMFILAVVMVPFITSCTQDEAAITQNITGQWQAFDSLTAYNGGLLMSQLGMNTDSIGALVTPVFKECSLRFGADSTGSMTLPALQATPISTTYKVSQGTVVINSAKFSKSIKLTIASITDSEMRVAMDVADVSTLAGVVDTTAANNPSLITLIESVVPAIAEIQKKIDKFGVNLSALGLNPSPTITLAFKRIE
jgi:hypothetical protein